MIGILALQGDYEKHQLAVSALGCTSILVLTAQDLAKCDGLILPGGESTTLINLLKKHQMWDALKDFSHTKPVLGTCAGCILLAKNVTGINQDSLKAIDVEITRNAYGRQVDSFIDDIKLQLNGTSESIEGVFIRAPKITQLGGGVIPLAWHNNDVVMAEQNNVLIVTFHPELTDNSKIHSYFINKIKKN